MLEEQLLLALLFVAAIATCAIASEKGRSAPAWALLGALVPVISLIAITLLPATPSSLDALAARNVTRGRQAPPRK